MKKIMKNIMLLIFCLLTIISQSTQYINVYAETVTIAKSTTSLNVRNKPTTSGSTVLGTLSAGQTVVVQEKTTITGSGCDDYWYKVTYQGSDAYVCNVRLEFSTMTISDQFPSSYQQSIAALQAVYPNATFTALYTNLEWDDAVENESELGISLIDGSDTTLRSKDPSVYNSTTNTYTAIEPGWYCASETTVAYYLDPRNFLDYKYVFMFEDLSFSKTLHTASTVQSILGNTYMPKLYSKYDTKIVSSGSDYDISAIHVASRILQETGVNGSTATSGASFVYSYDSSSGKGNGKTYSGLYNFFNIGAYSYSSPAIAGLIWANGGEDGSSTSYQRPWKTPESALAGGMQYLSTSYISKGQNTAYFQKFNVSPDAYYAAYTHQYMTNIRASYYEAASTYNSYDDLNLLDSEFEFLIPVYNNMPGESDYPTQEEEAPVEPTYPTVSIATIMSGLGITYDSSYLYGISVGTTASSMSTKIKAISTAATVTVKNSSGTTKTGTLVTGDKITITSAGETKTFEIVIYGDSNGDGEISIADLLRTQKIILNEVTVSNVYLKAADNNKDGSVTILDLLRVQKHILGEIEIK